MMIKLKNQIEEVNIKQENIYLEKEVNIKEQFQEIETTDDIYDEIQIKIEAEEVDIKIGNFDLKEEIDAKEEFYKTTEKEQRSDDLSHKMQERVDRIQIAKSSGSTVKTSVSPSSFFSPTCMEMDSESESELSDNIVPKKFVHIERELESAKKRLKQEKQMNITLKSENEGLKKEKGELESKILEMTTKLHRVEQLNLQYQEDFFKNLFQAQNNSGNIELKREGAVPMVSLGRTKILKETWERISASSKNSIFVKELTMAFWNKDTLINRSVTGRPSPFVKSIGKTNYKPLTPEKMTVIRDLYMKRLLKKGFSKKEAEDNISSVNRWVGEKIADLRKANRRLFPTVNNNNEEIE